MEAERAAMLMHTSRGVGRASLDLAPALDVAGKPVYFVRRLWFDLDKQFVDGWFGTRYHRA